QRPQHAHRPRRFQLQILAHEMLQHARISRTAAARHTGFANEGADRFRRIAATTQAADRIYTWIVPTVQRPFFHQLAYIALADDGSRYAQLAELILARRLLHFAFPNDPVIKRPLVLELNRAQRMG